MGVSVVAFLSSFFKVRSAGRVLGKRRELLIGFGAAAADGNAQRACFCYWLIGQIALSRPYWQVRRLLAIFMSKY
jgi:hypothetical protein